MTVRAPRPTPGASRLRRVAVPVVVVLLVGLAAAGLATRQLELIRTRSVTARLDLVADRQAEAVRDELDRYLDRLQSTKALVALTDELSQTTFERFVGELRMQERFPSLRALNVFAELDTAQSRRLAQRRVAGGERFELRLAEGRTRHALIVHRAPEPSDALGIDAYAVPSAERALRSSRRTGRPTLTEPFDFLVGGAGRGFVLYLPVAGLEGISGGISGGVNATATPVPAWVAAPFNGDTFVDEVLGREGEDVKVTLSDAGMPAAESFIAVRGRAADGAVRVQRALDVYGRRWVLDVEAGAGFEGLLDRVVPLVGGGLVLAAAAAVAVFVARQADRRLAAERRAQQSEEDLQDREEDYRLLAENATDLITRHDLEGRVLYASPAAADSMGLDPDAMLGSRLSEFGDQDDPVRIRQAFVQAARHGGTPAVGWRLAGGTQGRRWLETLVRALPGTDGAVVEFHATTRDVTARVEAEQAIRESEQRQQCLLEALQEGVVLTDDDGVTANPAASRLLGCELESWDLRRSAPQGAVDGDGAPLDVTDWPPAETHRTGGEAGPRVVGVPGPDGLRWLQCSAAPLEVGSTRNGVVTSLVDLTERVRIEDAYQQELGFVSALLETAGCAVIVTDGDGRVLICNRAGERLTGLRAPELVGERLLDLGVLLDPDPCADLTERGAGERAVRVDATIRAVDGTVRDVAWSSTAMSGPSGEITHLVATGIDVTEQKRVDRELRQTAEFAETQRELLQHVTDDLRRANEELEVHAAEVERFASQQRDFAAQASHELRTPITAIQGYLELVLEESDALSDDDRGYLEVVLRSTQRLSALVGDLLMVNKVEVGQLTLDLAEIELGDVVRQAAHLHEAAAARKGLRLLVDAGEALPCVTADRERIGQVLDNLLSNAIKFTETGEIRVSTSVLHDRVQVHVADSGVGISSEDLPQVFQRFFRTSQSVKKAVPGTGLGLAIAKSIVELQGGELSVTSREGQGSSFTVSLPLAKELV